MIMSLEPAGEEQEKFRSNFKVMSRSFAALPFKIPGTWFSRTAADDFDIDGCKIKKGWSLNLDVVSIHHEPVNFPEPHKFDPSRFDGPLKPYSFLGFGSGPRMCPGINLAKLEISIFIHHLVCRYKWRPLEKDDAVQPTLVRMPRNKYPIMVEPL